MPVHHAVDFHLAGVLGMTVHGAFAQQQRESPGQRSEQHPGALVVDGLGEQVEKCRAEKHAGRQKRDHGVGFHGDAA